ncbi:MAG: glycosyltransferase family 4 protein [Tepidimonas sp.]|uniref:glycosyltransferase family 4 protein n=1 Tax=Tepidimonas sp. TaxID=2002775 RepID=UPI004054D619
METRLIVEHYPQQRKSLRLSVVTETFVPEVNGVATSLERLVRGLQAHDHDIQVVRPRQPSDSWDRDGARLGLEQVITRGVAVPRYPGLRVGLPAQRSLQALWMQRRPDVVHIATEGPLGWSALRVARKLRLPLSTDYRTNFHSYSAHYGLGWLARPVQTYLRRFHNQADCTFVPTAALAQALQQMGFERVIVVPRGVDAQRFHPQYRSSAVRRSWGVVDDATPVALYVGRLAPEKNLPLLLRAYAAMRACDPRWRLVVVGDGPLRPWLARECPDALLLGALSGVALAQAYASGDVLLFPSLTETYGNVTLEALASGVPVVAFDYAAASEVVQPNVNGLLAPWAQEDRFVALAQSLASDAALVGRLRQGAAPSVQHLCWDALVQRMIALWQRLLAAHAAGPSAIKASAWWEGLPATGG